MPGERDVPQAEGWHRWAPPGRRKQARAESVWWLRRTGREVAERTDLARRERQSAQGPTVTGRSCVSWQRHRDQSRGSRRRRGSCASNIDAPCATSNAWSRAGLPAPSSANWSSRCPKPAPPTMAWDGRSPTPERRCPVPRLLGPRKRDPVTGTVTHSTGRSSVGDPLGGRWIRV
jgi:hypothetical protein